MAPAGAYQALPCPQGLAQALSQWGTASQMHSHRRAAAANRVGHAQWAEAQ